MNVPLLEIENATKVYGGSRGPLGNGSTVVALQDFNLTLPGTPAKIVTIAGESGSGKSTLAGLVLGFISLTSGDVRYKGRSIKNMTRQQRFAYQREVQVVFQDPYAVYNPFYRVRHIFDMVIRNFKMAKNKAEARVMIEEALNVVGMRGAEVLEKYPHQLSGGQRQRMMIARAYMLKPKLIVADEPVSAVDASLRAMILDIMIRLRDEQGISFLYITHDLSTAYQIGDQMFMLYQGAVTETGDTIKIIEAPQHPYVKELIGSIPVPDPTQKWDTNIVLPDDEQLRAKVDSGCRFYPRCSQRMERCLATQPPLYQIASDHLAACYLYDERPIAVV